LKTKSLLAAGGIAILVIALAGFAWIWVAPCELGGCAPLDDLAEYQAEGSEILDMNGDAFARLATVNRQIVSLDSLPAYLPQAFIAIEDQRFHSHGGVDLWRTGGALVENIREGSVAEGGSTITQQLARNLFPDWLPYTDRNLKRKVMEARVARQIERSFDKDKILELYLNHIYLGDGAYGVEAASLAYFGKPASQVTLVEAAMLAGLPQAPSQINPKANLERATARRNLVLAQMVDAGFISIAEAEELKTQPIELAEADDEPDGPESSYFVEQVRRELAERIGSRFYTAGLKIHTTLDPTTQQVAERELSRQLTAIENGSFGTFRHETYAERSRNGENSEYLQGAVVVLEAATGAVRALIGGRDFGDSKFNRATQALRQAGSAFKPFVYAAALERYRSPVHIVEDSPLQISFVGGEVWEPRNYTDQYDGPITIREALTRSKNTPTVRLSQDLGVNTVVSMAHRLGITTDIPSVPATSLGAADVRPLELIAAYAAFANGGDRVEPHLITRITDRNGNVVWQATPRRERVLDPALAFVLTSILQDVVDRGTGSAVRAVGFQGPAAGKTGTTNDASDAWFIGYTPDLVAGIWLGMDQPATIVRGASGGTLAAPVWGRMMRQIYESRPVPDPWRAPSGVVTAEVERSTGAVISVDCPPVGPTYTEYFIRSAPAQSFCPRDRLYTWMDSIWYDEDWGVFDSVSVQPYDTLTGAVDWPELDALRRRVRAAEEEWLMQQRESAGLPNDDSLGLPTYPDPRAPSDGLPRIPGTPPTQAADSIRPSPSTLTADEEQTVPAAPPRLLGVPVTPGGGR